MFDRTTIAFLVLMAVPSCYAGDQCVDGPLIGGNIYSIQNDTSKEQYVFVSADERARPQAWRRVTIRSGELATVNYYEGQYAIVVNVRAGKSQPEKYDMVCRRRYALRKDDRSGFITLKQIGGD